MCGLEYLTGYNKVPTSSGNGWVIDPITQDRGKYCPPSAGKWDDLQFLQLAGITSNYKLPKDEYS